MEEINTITEIHFTHIKEYICMLNILKEHFHNDSNFLILKDILNTFYGEYVRLNIYDEGVEYINQHWDIVKYFKNVTCINELQWEIISKIKNIKYIQFEDKFDKYIKHF